MNPRYSMLAIGTLVTSGLQAQDPGRSPTANDSVPHSIAEAEKQGALHPRLDLAVVASQIDTRNVPGSSDRRCVDVGTAREARSGDFIAGNFVAYPRIWAQGSGKLFWTPHHLGWPDSSTRLVVRAVPLKADSAARVFEKPRSARSVGVLPEIHFFATGFRLPSPGTWLLVATAGPQWGCFVFTFS